MSFDITISDDTAERLVTDVLRNTLECVRMYIKRLESLEHLEAYQMEELENNRKIESNLMEVIRFFTPPHKHGQI